MRASLHRTAVGQLERGERVARELLFPIPTGRLWRQRNFYRDGLETDPAALRHRHSPHECRHSYVTHLRAAGIKTPT